LALLGIVLYEILMRYIFNLSQLWAFETSLFVFGTLFALGGAYTLLHQGHVKMDILYVRWPPKARAIMDIITFLLFLIFIGVLLWKGWNFAIRAIELGEKSNSPWAPYLWPTKIMIPIGAFLVLLQGLSQLIRNILIVAGKGNPDEY
jgi:TRAP-type mannitol/chloroaromatic compound transport system permease small subunit